MNKIRKMLFYILVVMVIGILGWTGKTVITASAQSVEDHTAQETPAPQETPTPEELWENMSFWGDMPLLFKLMAYSILGVFVLSVIAACLPMKRKRK